MDSTQAKLQLVLIAIGTTVTLLLLVAVPYFLFFKTADTETVASIETTTTISDTTTILENSDNDTPIDISWNVTANALLPTSENHGPRRFDRANGIGFANTKNGAGLAAIYILNATLEGQSEEVYQFALINQVSGQEENLKNKLESASIETSGFLDLIYRGWTTEHITEEQALVTVYEGKDIVTAYELQLNWVGNDWVAVAPVNGEWPSESYEGEKNIQVDLVSEHPGKPGSLSSEPLEPSTEIPQEQTQLIENFAEKLFLVSHETSFEDRISLVEQYITADLKSAWASEARMPVELNNSAKADLASWNLNSVREINTIDQEQYLVKIIINEKSIQGDKTLVVNLEILIEQDSDNDRLMIKSANLVGRG